MTLCLTILFHIPSFSQDTEEVYNFAWDPNDPSENVHYYRLRFGPGLNDYDPIYVWPRIDGGSASSYSFSLPNPDEVTLPDNFYPLENVDTVYFALTAVNEDGAESGLSDNQPFVSVSFDDDDDNGGGGGGSGGLCFISRL